MNLSATHPKSEALPTARILLDRLIDYAGLFPPAGLDMHRAVANYDAYLRSEHAWMLSRFIVPAARLSEFEDALRQMPSQSASPWRLSALLGADPPADLARIAAFRANPRAMVESIEVKVNAPEDVKRLAGNISSEFETYIEVPLTGREGEFIAAIAKAQRRAKIRTGGETADKIPAPIQIIDFMKLCAEGNVAFKATAGLHHPLRSAHHLTYQPDSASALMHGFINVFLAAAFLRGGMATQSALELLEDRSIEAFRFDAEGVTWRNHRVSHGELAAARHGFSLSFGSCSFTEPVDDLRSLHLL